MKYKLDTNTVGQKKMYTISKNVFVKYVVLKAW